jgi:prolipoprotein diacylglyceryltransferase
LPTGAFLAFVAVYLGLEIAGRYGRRLGLRLDDVWNTGLIAVATGLIVARLWNVIQFSYVYSAEPGLLFSVRPSGFSLLPGIIAALAGAYVYLWRRRLSPSAMAAAFAAGGLLFLAVLGISDFLTGAVVGLPSDRPSLASQCIPSGSIGLLALRWRWRCCGLPATAANPTG